MPPVSSTSTSPPLARAVVAGGVGGVLGGVGAALLSGWGPRTSAIDGAAVVGALVGALVVAVVGRRRPQWPVGTAVVVFGIALYLGRLLVVRPSLAFVPVAAAAVAALVLHAFRRGRPWPEPTADDDGGAGTATKRFLVGPLVVGTVGAVVYTVWSAERHRRFGSGSWDHGCYLHNAWLFAHGDAFSVSARSSVLGDVAFWGGTNHFMPSLVLTAPLAWLMEATGSTALLLVAQAVVVAAAVVPLALLARHAGLGRKTTTALCGAYLFAVPTQAFLLFDVHEVAPVPLLTFVVLWLVRTRAPSARVVVVVAALLLLLAGCKESCFAYAAALGVWMVASAPGWRRHGALVTVGMAVGFVVVTGVVQPALLEPGGRMIHVAHFVTLDDAPAKPGLAGVAASILLHPGRALAALVTPDVKLATIGTSAGAFGGLPLVSGEAMALALPYLAERFLSDKREMWGLGFHYGLVGVALLAVGALDVLRQMRARFADARAFDLAGAAALVTALVGSQLASPVSPELASFSRRYYANDDAVARYRRALAVIGDDDDVVAQNYFLPHVALRRHVWLPERRFVDRANAVVLDPESSPWPHDRRYVERLLGDLQRDDRFFVAFHERSTWVFRRR